MVHRGMLPRPRRNLDNRECRCRAQEATQGRQTAGGRGIQHQPSKTGGRPKGRGYCGHHGNGVTGRYVGALPPAMVLMVPVWGDVEHDPRGELGAVPDGLNPGGGSSSLLKFLRPGPQA